MEKQSMEVTIFGETYHIVSDETNHQHLLEIARLVDEKMKMLAESNPRFTRLQVAILAALNLGEETLKNENSAKAQEELNQLQNQYGQETKEMLNRIIEISDSISQVIDHD